MAENFKVALAQMMVTDNGYDNLRLCEQYMQRAHDEGARLVLFPEGIIARNPTIAGWTKNHAQPLDGPFVSGLVKASEKFGLAVSCTVHTPSENYPDKVFNVHIVADQGRLIAQYRKLHLYDAFNDKESDDVVAGTDVPPIIEIDGWHFGLMTCYDLRFPELARRLVLDGAEAILVPAAWVRGPLKESHWNILVRARALENTAYVVAVSEVSVRNIGCSMLVDPLGVPIAQAGSSEELMCGVMKKSVLQETRQTLPVLQNRRFSRPELTIE